MAVRSKKLLEMNGTSSTTDFSKFRMRSMALLYRLGLHSIPRDLRVLNCQLLTLNYFKLPALYKTVCLPG